MPGAAAVIGSLMGAVLAAALVTMEGGGGTGEVQAAARRAMDIAVGGLQALGRDAPPARGTPGSPMGTNQ